MVRNRRSPTRWVLLSSLLLVCVCVPAQAEDADEYSPEELQEIVGPIALYPDIVLSSLLPASTAPTDVVQAARWVKGQSGEITATPEDSGWDPAVEAMVQFPDVLTWMSDNLDWMEMLAYAVAVQEDDVLQAIQDFRVATEEAGNLESNEQVQVVQEQDVIYIQPAQPEVVYVPTYDPVAVTQPGYAWSASSWGVGFAMGAVGAWAVHGIRWGGHGHHGSINVNRQPQFNFNNNGNINTGNIGSGNRWNAANKPNRRPNQRPGNNRPSQRPNRPGGARPGKGGVKPGTGRPGAGNRPGRPGGDRPGTPSRPPSRPGAGDRPGRPGGDRPGAGNRPERPSRPPSRPGGGASRPSKPPSRPGGGASRPSKPPSRPSTAPNRSKGSRSMMGGSSNHGRSTSKASNRGRSSSSQSRSRSSGSRSSGASRGGSRGGGSRGGGGRGGGGRRR